MALCGLIADAMPDSLPISLGWLGVPPGPDGLSQAFEEGLELMAAVDIAVLFVEMLTTRADAARVASGGGAVRRSLSP